MQGSVDVGLRGCYRVSQRYTASTKWEEEGEGERAGSNFTQGSRGDLPPAKHKQRVTQKGWVAKVAQGSGDASQTVKE